jgi:site-specific recombinase XerD
VSKLSSHSLRKSFAYQLRVKFGVDVQTISEQMNHSSVQVTLIYAGLAEDEKVKLTQLGL